MFVSVLAVCVVYSTHLKLMLNSIFPLICMMYSAIDLVGEILTLYQRNSWHYILTDEKEFYHFMYTHNKAIKYRCYTYIHTYTYISFHQCMKIQVVFSSDLLLCDIWLSWVNQRHLFTVEAEFTSNALYELRRICVFNLQIQLQTLLTFR